MSWNEAEFGRDDGIVCDEIVNGTRCGAATWVMDDDGRGYVSYECEKGHFFAVQYEYDEEHEPDCWCADCVENAQWDDLRDIEMYGEAGELSI